VAVILIIIFGWGFISKDSVAAMAIPPLEGERQAVVRRGR
jgi:hypothetical protein